MNKLNLLKQVEANLKTYESYLQLLKKKKSPMKDKKAK